MKALVALLLLCAAAALFFFWPKPASEGDRLIVGTNAEYPPYSFVENGEIVGFDIDIAKEVCRRLGKTMVLQDMPFEALIPALAMNRVDFVAAGLTYTDERAKRLLFSRPYISGDPLVIVTNDKEIKGVEALVGKKVLVNDGYTADLYLSSIDGIDLIRLAAPSDAFAALASGRADAFVTALSTVKSFPSHSYLIIPMSGSSDAYSLAFNRDNHELHEKVQALLDEMESDGTLLRLQEKWGL